MKPMRGISTNCRIVGMFLYARLVLDYLSKNIFYTGKEIKAAIDGLPEELTELCVIRNQLIQNHFTNPL
jgi:hypothetical protein